MEKRIIIGVAAVAGAVGLLYIMKRQTSQATNTAAANTSGSASALLSGLLSGWANPASTVPPAAVVAASGTITTKAPAASAAVNSPIVQTQVAQKPASTARTSVYSAAIANPSNIPRFAGETVEQAQARVKGWQTDLFTRQDGRAELRKVWTDTAPTNPAPAPAPAAAPAAAPVAPVWGANGENFA